MNNYLFKINLTSIIYFSLILKGNSRRNTAVLSLCLAENRKMCYTYDELNRVKTRTIKDLNGNVLSEESFNYDAAGNITAANEFDFAYDTNNRLTEYLGHAVEYDADGNMLSNSRYTLEYDSANRLVKACNNIYTYNAEDIRIRNVYGEYDTTYTYNTNCKLSQLLTKTTNNITTKYVYGLGLIGQEKENEFKTYHFDYRGSTVAITNINGTITDTFKYNTYGKLIERTGDSFIIFGYNGRDGVITDNNGLIYMRARYYSPDMRRFVNADILHGEISDSTSLNRYSYVNGNPVSYVDPFGLAKWWETALKVTAGVAVIAGLAVATVATGGTAAVIAGAALAGATISGTASIVSGVVAGDSADEIATSFMMGTISGSASGALTASGAPGLAVAAGNLVIDVGEYVIEESIDGNDEQVTVGGIISTAAFSLAPDLLPKFDFNTKKFVKGQLDAGWLHKGSSFYNELIRHDSVVQEYSKRANKKHANKQISRSLDEYNNFMSVHWDTYLRGLVFDEIKNSFNEPFQQNIGQFIDNQFALQLRK